MLTHNLSQPQRPRRVVILGSGFIGRAVALEAEAHSYEVIALNSKDIDLTLENAGMALADVLEAQDSIIFSAALDNGHASDSGALLRNLAMAQHVAEATRLKKPAHLIYISSDAVYDPGASLLNEEIPAAPSTLYGAMHRSRELLLAAEGGVALAILRPTAIYGAGDSHNAYGPNRFMREAFEKKTITLFGDGEEMRDHLCVADAARLIMLAAQHRSTGLLNLSSGQPVSFYKLATLFSEQTGASINKTPRKIGIAHRHHDVTQRLMAFPAFSPVSLETGIRQLLKTAPR